MKLLIDMNLSPTWVSFLAQHGIEAIHWSSVGRCDAPDSEVFSHAISHDFVVFTNDLDFGAILAHTGNGRPSVIQIRTPSPTPTEAGQILLRALGQFQAQLKQGALITVLPRHSKARILPL